MTCAERRDAILLFSAGLLEEPEAAELRTHLASGCEACTSHLAEAREVEYALAAAAPGGAAPHLRGELLRRIDRLPQQSVRTRPRASARVRRSLVPLALAAGLGAAIAAPIAWWLAAERHTTRFAEREAALVAELEDARDELAETEDELSEIEARERRVDSDLERAHRQVAMLSEMSLVTLDLKPVSGLPKEAQARVFWEWDDYYCYLHAEGLPAQDAPVGVRPLARHRRRKSRPRRHLLRRAGTGDALGPAAARHGARGARGGHARAGAARPEAFGSRPAHLRSAPRTLALLASGSDAFQAFRAPGRRSRGAAVL